MSTTAEKVMSEALELPPALRAYVAEKLIESLDATEAPPLSPAWKAEITRRCEEMDRMIVELQDAEAVFAEAYATLA